MTIEDFLYNIQFKRKISVNHYMFTKQVFISILAIIIYYLFFKQNSKYDAIFYLLAIAYAMRSYITTRLIYSDKLNNISKDSNIFLYKKIADSKKKNIKKEQDV